MTHKTLRKDRAEITLRAVFTLEAACPAGAPALPGGRYGRRGHRLPGPGGPSMGPACLAGPPSGRSCPGPAWRGHPPASLPAPRPGGGGIRTDQAPLPITDQILTARAVESLQHQLPVLGLAPLHQCPLEGLVVGRAGTKTGCMVRGSRPVYHMQVDRVPGVG